MDTDTDIHELSNEWLTKEEFTKFQTKLFTIQQELAYLQKSGRNTMQNYNYVGEADVKAAIRKGMDQYGVIFDARVIDESMDTFETAKGTHMWLAKVTMELTLRDSESPASISWTASGHGMDAGDKAIYKAQTGAIKQGLRDKFLIPTGDEPERDEKAGKDVYVEESQAPITPHTESTPIKDGWGSFLLERFEAKSGKVPYTFHLSTPDGTIRCTTHYESAFEGITDPGDYVGHEVRANIKTKGQAIYLQKIEIPGATHWDMHQEELQHDGV